MDLLQVLLHAFYLLLRIAYLETEIFDQIRIMIAIPSYIVSLAVAWNSMKNKSVNF